MTARESRAVLWEQLFRVDPDSGLPLQAQLRTCLVRAILDGVLAPETPLPSSRHLAELLNISRNTVTGAYQQLVDEAFLESRSRSGFFVKSGAHPAVAELANSPTALERTGTSSPVWNERVRRSRTPEPMLAKPANWRQYPFAFVYGLHDAELFPTEAFRECCVRSLARVQLANWAPDFETEDVPELVEQIRQRLLPRRGVFALAEEIVVTVGAQQAFHLLAEALFDQDTRLGFEEPGYPNARNAFRLRDPVFMPLPLDEHGVVVDGSPDIDYLFVTPSHQCPTTVTMNLERRSALLAAAQQRDFVVIEDDYEADNLHTGTPMPALKSLDRNGRVIYVGSLSKSLSPALRLGYIVAPAVLADALRSLRHSMVRHPSAFLQHAYAQFLSLGHHDSHARRVNQAMQERIACALASLRVHLPDCQVNAPLGGASVWVKGPPWLDASALHEKAKSYGVLIESGAAFFAAPPAPCPYFRLRLSSIPISRIDEGIKALREAMLALAQQHKRFERIG